MGEGAFSVCYLVEDSNGVLMAGKFFTRKTSSSRKRLERFEREVNIMKSLQHSNIVKFYGAISGVRDNKTFNDFRHNETVLYVHPPVMFMEYCSGMSLSTFLKARADRNRYPNKKYGQLNEDETLWVAECTCRALAYLKDKMVLHRDIKMGNMLLQNSVDPKSSLLNAGIVLCDFGLATQLESDNQHISGTAGTPRFFFLFFS